MVQHNLNPCVEMESHNGIREVGIYTRHLSKRRIFLNGEINAETANATVAQLLYLQDESEEPIFIYINSNGGEINAGLYIYDVLQSMTVPVYMYCTGMAASMAALLLAGGLSVSACVRRSARTCGEQGKKIYSSTFQDHDTRTFTERRGRRKCHFHPQHFRFHSGNQKNC